MTDPTDLTAPEADENPRPAITDPVHVDRLHRVLTRISNGLGEFWDQSMWFRISDSERRVQLGLDDMPFSATRTVPIEELAGPDGTPWSCGTGGCLAGHLVLDHDTVTAVVLNSAGDAASAVTAEAGTVRFAGRGAELIGIDDGDRCADVLFDGNNELVDLWLLAEHLTGGAITPPAAIVADLSPEELARRRTEVAELLDLRDPF